MMQLCCISGRHSGSSANHYKAFPLVEVWKCILSGKNVMPSADSCWFFLHLFKLDDVAFAVVSAKHFASSADC